MIPFSDTDPEPEPAAHKPEWRRRWAVIRLVLLFCAALVAQIALFGPDDGLRESALLGLLALSGSVVLGYLGFATLDDRNWMQSLGARGIDGEGRR